MAIIDKDAPDVEKHSMDNAAKKRDIARRIADEIAATSKGLEPWKSTLENYQRVQLERKSQEQ